MLAKNLQHGAHRLARQPGFTLVAVLCLGLGIGANTAIFSLLEGVVQGHAAASLGASRFR